MPHSRIAYTTGRKYDFKVGVFTTSSPEKTEINSRSVSTRGDQSVSQTTNHLKNACLSFVSNTSILMDYMHYSPASDLICMPHCADYKITLLMHWFCQYKIDGADESKNKKKHVKIVK